MKSKLETLGRQAKDLLKRSQSNSRLGPSSQQGSNPRNNASGGLDGTNQDTDDEAPTPVPWEEWILDSNFLQNLYNWNIAHDSEDEKLLDLLAKINSVIESDFFEAALGFIPDTPFPAKSLVKAIINLFLRGSKIPGARKSIYDFSKQIVVEITNLADVFGDTGGGKLKRKAWEDLQETRDLVNDICRWANDKYQNLRNVSSAMKELKEVKEKIDDARSKFMGIGIIRALGALDNVIDGIEELRQDSSQSRIVMRLQSINQTLGDRVVPQAKYVSKGQKELELHRETCKGVLDKIEQWACTHDSDTKNCWWITGRPGVGKSTIGVKVAEISMDEKSLYAQYFITPNIVATTNPNNIIPTMAQQLAEKAPLAARLIQNKLKTTPLGVLEKFSPHQAEVLLLEPLRAIAQYSPKVMIIIDGVDELANAKRSKIPEITSILCSTMSNLPANVKILIFSRPERWITDEIPNEIKRLNLSTEYSESHDDVERLVRAKLRDLAKVHRWDDWPSENQVDLLCQLAAGHLGSAASALNWIGSQLEVKMRDGRDETIKKVSQFGMEELDERYALILERILPPRQDPVRKSYLEGLKTVLGYFVVAQELLDIDSISTLLSLDNFNVPDCMKRISSLIDDGTEPQTGRTVPRVHKSVVDYLVSSRPASDLRIDPTEQHHSLTTSCFKSIQRLTFNVGRIASSHGNHDSENISISQDITYSCQWLGLHLKKGGKRATLVPDVEKFMKIHFLQWLEVLALKGLVDSVAISTLKILEEYVKASMRTRYGDQDFSDENSTLVLFIGDAIKFVKIFEQSISFHPSHIYISALPLAPSDSLVSKHYLPQYPHTLSVRKGPRTWDELQENPIIVNKACISLDGRLIAAVFDDGTLHIYNITGESIRTIELFESHPSAVIFSRDGGLVASGGQALRLWNVQTGVEVEGFLIEVFSLALSPDRNCIAVGCGESGGKQLTQKGDGKGCYNIRVINLNALKSYVPPLTGKVEVTRFNGEISSSPFEGHERRVYNVAYSPNGKRLVSTSDDMTLRVWDVLTGERIMIKSTTPPNWTSRNSVTFSPDGTQLAVDKRLFNLSTNSIAHHVPGNTVQPVNSLAFSGDGKFLASGIRTAACQIWGVSSQRTIIKLIGHTGDIDSLAFFADDKKMMSASKDGTIRVWKVESLEEGGKMDGWRMDNEVKARGWIRGPEKEYIFWTPLPFRHMRNTLVIGECLGIDFSNFVHGDEWWKCREPLESKATTGPQGMEVIHCE